MIGTTYPRDWVKPTADSTDRQLVSLGERRLLVAMLELAFSDLESDNKRVSAVALRWITNPSEETYFTFKGACEVLGFDPHELRHWAMLQSQWGRLP